MKSLSSATLWIIMFLVIIILVINYQQHRVPDKLPLTEWLAMAKNNQIISAVDETGSIRGAYSKAPMDAKARAALDEKTIASNTNIHDYITYYADGQSGFILQELEKLGVKYNVEQKSTFLSQILLPILLPVAMIFILWMLLMRQIQGGGNKAMSFGKSRAKLVKEGEIKITFKDVAGVEEAREELGEIVDYLKDPKKFSRLGGRIPHGVLLVGPPGTGKTLLARAIAGEAGVPFFSISGSDFVEMFVGVGASRVRDLFEQAKKAKPCIIFIDEIDAVGRHRFAGIGGGHDEREQTLNQLLVEMDGFAENEGVIMIAATNRPDVLDPALLRPGRFDRQIMVDLPDIRGREQILNVHARKIRMDGEVDLTRIAKGTPGFSGADLANLINEAALLAARRNKETVGYLEFEEAKDRVMMGPERKSLVITEKEKMNTAFHEAGHALVAHFTPGTDPVHKITIVPRGRALGVTWILPGEDRHSMTRQMLINQLCYAMGGRAAEEIHFGEFTTGASNDIERATSLAHRMVCQYGMSDRLGPRAFGEPSGHVFLGKEITRERNYSEETATLIDEEVKRLIDEAHQYATNILKEKRDVLDRVSEALMERETLDDREFLLLVEGKPLPPIEHVVPPQPPPLGKALKPERPKAPSITQPEVQPS